MLADIMLVFSHHLKIWQELGKQLHKHNQYQKFVHNPTQSLLYTFQELMKWLGTDGSIVPAIHGERDRLILCDRQSQGYDCTAHFFFVPV